MLALAAPAIMAQIDVSPQFDADYALLPKGTRGDTPICAMAAGAASASVEARNSRVRTGGFLTTILQASLSGDESGPIHALTDTRG